MMHALNVFMKRSPGCWALLWLAVLLLPAPGQAAVLRGNGAPLHQNVLFIAVDDLRPQLGCYGHEQIISPNIDRLAEQGVLFNRAYCMVPTCGASRASLLTGVRPTRNRFINYSTWAQRDLPGVTTLQTHFKNHGYHTVSNGKVFHHPQDHVQGWSEPPWRPPPGATRGRGYVTPESFAKMRGLAKGLGPAYEAADVPDNTYADGKLADKAISDLQRLDRMDKPFFLAVGFFKPHLPFVSPQKYWDLYPRQEIKLADNPFRPRGAPAAAMHNWGELRAYADIPKQGPLDDEFARTLIHGYYASVSFTDAQIGRVLDELKRLGLDDNTIVVLWGDHGWQLGEHGLWCKHCNFETSLYAPLILRAPTIAGRKKTDRLVEFIDIYPSLCELAGLPIPGHLAGKSFVPLMKDPRRPWKKAVFSRYRNGDSMRTDRYRYTEFRDGKGRVNARMLYDHRNDPSENVNVAERPENAELVERLSRQLRDHVLASAVATPR